MLSCFPTGLPANSAKPTNGSFRNERLSFTDGLVSTEKELSVVDILRAAVEELLSHGKIDNLLKLLESSWEGWELECQQLIPNTLSFYTNIEYIIYLCVYSSSMFK
jgi:hypothetical protein